MKKHRGLWDDNESYVPLTDVVEVSCTMPANRTLSLIGTSKWRLLFLPSVVQLPDHLAEVCMLLLSNSLLYE